MKALIYTTKICGSKVIFEGWTESADGSHSDHGRIWLSPDQARQMARRFDQAATQVERGALDTLDPSQDPDEALANTPEKEH